MSERPDWSECLYRPSMLCGERDEKMERGPADMRDIWHMTEARPPPQLQPQNGQPPLEAPPAEAPILTPVPEPTLPEVPIRHKGLLFSSYWLAVSDVYAGVGDVVVVKNASDYVIIRQVPKSNHWVDDTLLRISGYVERRLCIYGFVLSRDIERIAAELRSGRFALVAACDPRAVVRPPRREELYSIWRYEGYIVNTSPARMALIRLDMTRKPKFAVDFLKKGCPIYSQHLNQILQLSGIPIQLTC
ncbi:MAG: hypothetical protein ACO2PN_27305 [Pyrobaculum sp.]